MRKLKTIEIKRLSVEEYHESKKTPLVVVLDDVRSLHNVGSVFRTCDAFRVERICLCGITATPPLAEIHKTALGAEDSVEWKHYDSVVDCVNDLHQEGRTVFAIEQCEGSIMAPLNLQEVAPDAHSFALILGNEVKGVHQEAIDLCDHCLEIPQFGTKHSMNVSVTAGIAIWEFIKNIVFALLLLVSIPANAESLGSLEGLEVLENLESLDSLEVLESLVSFEPTAPSTSQVVKGAVVPTALFGVGLFGVYNGWCKDKKSQLNNWIADQRDHKTFMIEDKLQYLPAVACFALPLVGVKSKYNFTDRLCLTATQMTANLILTHSLKRIIKEPRPDTGAETSFPSGHTATVFMGAENLRLSYGNTIGYVAYGYATLIGCMRVWNNRHYVNDVVAGAGIGILCARTAHWLLPWEKKILGFNKKEKDNTTVVALPFYTPADGGFVGTSVAINF